MLRMVQLNMKMPEPLEKDIQKSILEYLQAKRIFCWKQATTGIYKPDGTGYIPVGLKGVSDILGVLSGGRFLAIEVKRPSGKLSEAQVEFLQNINLHGGLGFVAHSIDDVIAQGI
jgi:penicillin-binding protein-related factor A (putative recombinase)